jgi:hypothetical protein
MLLHFLLSASIPQDNERKITSKFDNGDRANCLKMLKLVMLQCPFQQSWRILGMPIRFLFVLSEDVGGYEGNEACYPLAYWLPVRVPYDPQYGTVYGTNHTLVCVRKNDSTDNIITFYLIQNLFLECSTCRFATFEFSFHRQKKI